jgi:hypothetical protein
MKSFREYLIETELQEQSPSVGDVFEMELARDETLIETVIVDLADDGIVIEADDTMLQILRHAGYLTENPTGMPPATSTISPIHSNVNREHSSDDDLEEAKYRGREVPLGKKMKGDVKKSKVYVRKPNGNIVKVEFGDPNMRIKKSNPKRRKSFRARHNCDNPGPRWKARYWSCRAW